MSKVKVGFVAELISQAIKKAGGDTSIKGLKKTANVIGITEDYLYKKAIPKTKGRDENEEVSMRESILDRIADYLSFLDFKAFMRSVSNPPDAQLLSCSGTYYSYVRENAAKGFVLRSPVKVSQSERGFRMDLAGPSSKFSGNLTRKDGCLFVLLESQTGKRFYHVYRIGNRENPVVLQGVFAGVTTNLEPIGGRVVLVRVDESFATMKVLRREISVMKKSKDKGEKILAAYFEEYENNNAAPYKSYCFDWEDLAPRR